jgi:hypothetical protein
MGTPFRFKLHPEAAKSFNEKADALFRRLAPRTLKGRPPRAYKPDAFVSAQLTEKDILGEIETGLVDQRGTEVAKFFQNGDRAVGLSGPSFQILADTVRRFQSLPGMRNTVSYKCLLDITFQWLKMRYRGSIAAPFVEAVVTECEKRVREIEIWIPVFRLFLETEVQIGRVVFKTITREMLDSHEEILKAALGGEIAKMQDVFTRERKDLQGVAAATVKLLAEPIRASEIAEEEAEKAVSLLRFLHPASSSPYLRCYCTLLGRQALRSSTHLTVEDGKILSKSQRIQPRGSSAWIIDTAEITELKAIGLDALSKMLGDANRTEFEDDLLEAIILYSKNALVEDPADKLVYVFAALESILLKDRNEPVQKNLGARMAFLVGQSAEARLQIVENVGRSYGLRSSFVHHGESPDDMATLEVFMKFACLCFVGLIDQTRTFRTKGELIEALERRKMR